MNCIEVPSSVDTMIRRSLMRRGRPRAFGAFGVLGTLLSLLLASLALVAADAPAPASTKAAKPAKADVPTNVHRRSP